MGILCQQEFLQMISLDHKYTILIIISKKLKNNNQKEFNKILYV